ncbi:MAG: PIN domain-containing protein [Candidatus Obscuribacterales bacterium]|nr:PIN domain-containing protein [Candidatus Obscuribacterales bacterium]
MPFQAIYDACLLYPFEVRDILMVAAGTRLFAVRWTDTIMDEFTRNLIKDGRANKENMARLRNDMNRLYPRANIPLKDYESLIPAMTCDPKDRHVLAAAVSKGVDVIVTRNMKDFPPESLEPYSIETQSADEFTGHVLDLNPSLFIRHFHGWNEQKRHWAKKQGKQPHSDIEVAQHLAYAEPPMPDTSKQLIQLLRK